MTQEWFIGLMSGTSTDGVDGVLARFEENGACHIAAQAFVPMPAELRDEFLALNRPGPNELARSHLAANSLADLYAAAVERLLADARLASGQVRAIGAHGQTVRHHPAAGYTIQLNAPALLAELTGIGVIADFRSRDVAAGGQGAPLVPAFHQSIFGGDHPRAVLNLGGIANVTVLRPGEPVRGFDTGPANMLLDTWVQRCLGKPFDAGGQWAASGRVDHALLSHLLESEPWFHLPPPKSTGRDLFNEAWLMERLAGFAYALSDADVQATLQQLTCVTIADAISRHAEKVDDVLVCGGGALNTALICSLRDAMGCPVHPTTDFGLPVQTVEAAAFAWLAWAHVQGKPAGLPSVTGARHATVLGCHYPA